MQISDKFRPMFLLDPTVAYLNFGSFGACPRPVFEDYQQWQLLLEHEPVQFIAVNASGNMATSRKALGNYVNCNADDLVFTPNPTFAMNIIAKNLRLDEGDEILATNLEYGAMDRTWSYYCGLYKARYVRQQITLPIVDKESFLEQFWRGYTSRTKAIFISQITSATGLILPVKEICDKAKSLGLMTMVDGAHVPGHVKLDLSDLKADIFTGACHKWMMTPKGSSFLYVKKELQNDLDPLIVSWGYEGANPTESQFLDYHQFNGTRDFSAYLTIPAAISFMQENNWTDVASTCRRMVKDNAARFCELLNTEPLCPLSDEFLGQMLSLPIATKEPEKLQRLLFSDYRIEIPVMRHENNVYLRYSINAFNSQNDLDRLYDAILKIRSKSPSLI